MDIIVDMREANPVAAIPKYAESPGAACLEDVWQEEVVAGTVPAAAHVKSGPLAVAAGVVVAAAMVSMVEETREEHNARGAAQTMRTHT